MMEDSGIYEPAERRSIIGDVITDKHVAVLLEKLSWKPFESILHYACGAGSLTSRCLYPVAEQYSSAITGVDTSPELIKAAEVNCPHTLVTYSVGDIMVEDWFKRPLLNTKFNKIICINYMNLVRNYEEFLKRLCHHLHRGGQLALGVPYSKFHSIHALLSEHPRWRKYMSISKDVRVTWVHEVGPDFPEKIRSSLEFQGLKVLDISVLEESSTYETIEGLIDFVMATNAGTRNVPEELQADLREEIEKLALNILELPPGSLTMPAVKTNYLRLVAEKQS